MNFFDAIILGIVQGLTEFLPISSSAHLVITPALLNIPFPSIFFDVVIHLGTLFAVIVFWFRRIKNITISIFRFEKNDDARLGFLIIIGTIPTVIIGFLFKDILDRLFESPIEVACFLLITGVLLFLTRFTKERKERMNILDAIIIGIFQGFAVVPGISRSGACISAGLFLGLKRKFAFDFAFLLSIPAIFAAFTLELKEVLEGKEPVFLFPYIAGFIVSFIVGLICLSLLARIVRKGKIHYFAYYCFLFGLFMIWFLWLK
ncbi:TPA: undecaprenyl-diphosphatase UppP [bacterium]|nr:undecaprenyl-diphosphatase UppP [bacterium]